MKRTASFLVGAILWLGTFAQAPQGFNYQAVVRNAQGEPLAEQQVSIRLTLQDEAGKAIHYSETHSVITSPQGVVNFVVGSGAVESGTFTAIPWADGTIRMKVEVDPAGGSNYTTLGVAQLQSVPYALYAANSTPGPEGPQGPEGPVGPQGPEGPLVAGTEGQTLRHSGTTWEADSNIYNTGYNVGIGTTSPTEKLDVEGNIRAHGLMLNRQGTPDDEPLFVVRNSDGNIVFAVYEQGVRIYVDGDPSDEGKGNRSGFAIGGLTGLKDTGEEYFRVSRGYTQVMFDDEGKGNRSGFAIGGLTGLKADEDGKDYLSVSRELTQVLFDDAGKGNRSGFAIGGLTGLKGKEGNDGYMSITPENYLIGQEAGSSLTTGLYNSFMGYQAGKDNSYGNNNIFMGYQSGHTNISGSNNVFMGNQTGFENDYGENNVFIGNNTGYSNTGGSRNVFLGNNAGYNNTSGFGNIFLGNLAGQNNTTGYWNIFIGELTGESNFTGMMNTFLGDHTGTRNVSGSQNVFLGELAGSFNVDGHRNVFIGSQAGHQNVSGEANVAVGNLAGYRLTGNDNISIGYQSGGSGFSTGDADASLNVFIGGLAGRDITTGGDANTFVGFGAGSNNTTGQNNVYLGGSSGGFNKTGSYNVAIGYWTGPGSGAVDVSNNVLIGPYVGKELEGGAYNVILGSAAAYSKKGGSDNVILGPNANYNGGNGSNNTIVGSKAGFVSVNGSGNVFLGYQAGYYENGDDKLYIANSDTDQPLIYGDFSESRIRINGKTVEPAYTFYVQGPAGGTGAWNSASDGRLKTNVRPLEGALSKVLRLNGVTFNWKDEAYHRPGENIGFIAQDLLKVLPQVVSGGGSDNQGNEVYYSVEYATLTPVLVEAIKEQQKMIEELKAEIEQLKKNQAK